MDGSKKPSEQTRRASARKPSQSVAKSPATAEALASVPSPEQDRQILLLAEKLKQQEEQTAAFAAFRGQLEGEAATLREECRRLKRHHLIVTGALNRELEAATQEAAALRTEMDTRRLQMQQETEAVALKSAELAAGAAGERQALEAQIGVLTAAVAGLEEFRHRREELEAATQQAQREVERLTKHYEEQLGEAHLRSHRLNQKFEQLERDAATAAADFAQTEAYLLLQQNRKLSAALRKAQEDVEKLNEQGRDVDAQMASMRAELHVAKEVEAKAVEGSAQHYSRAAALNERVAALQEELTAVQAAKEESLAAQIALSSELAAAQQSQESKQRQKDRMVRQVQRARQSAHDLLMERSEAQAFLVTSIRQVTQYVTAEKALLGGSGAIRGAERAVARGRRRAGPALGPPLPAEPTAHNANSSSNNSRPTSPIARSSRGSEASADQSSSRAPSSSADSAASSSSLRSTAIAAAARVNKKLDGARGSLTDIATLSWEEREAVLRLLLAQVNGRAVATELARSAFAAIEKSGGDAAAPEKKGMDPLVEAQQKAENRGQAEHLDAVPEMASPTL